MVTWLTPDRGRLNTLMKGALRPKSPFLGHVDLFYTCELLYYSKATEGLPITRECTALNTRPRLREDWRACAVASYLCSLLSRAIPEKASRESIFRWLEAALDELSLHGGSVPALCWQELRLLSLLGLSPRFGHCRQCGAEAGGADVPFSIADGGWRCVRCRNHEALRHVVWVPGPILTQLAAWQAAPDPAQARSARFSFSQRSALERLPGLFISHHLDVAPDPRSAALDILSRHPPRPS